MAIDLETRKQLEEGALPEGGPHFEEMRVQVPYPCQARCVWCSTWKKNPRFEELYNKGTSDEIMDFYARVVEHEKPRRLMLSGGEPILYPRINDFLERVSPHVENIFLYTSYQYKPESLAHVDKDRIPGDKMVFTHSVIDFLPDNWHKGTQHLTPHERYVENIRIAKDWPGRKIIKFVLNHEHLREEVELFRKLVEPDASFHLEAKLLNNQSNNYGKKQIEKTKSIVHENRKFMGTSNNNEIQLNNIMEGRIVENCIHWKLPELRFALYKEDPHVILKYRFCGYFAPDFAYKIHLHEYKKGMFHKAFQKGRFKEACNKCRLLFYKNPVEEGSVEES